MKLNLARNRSLASGLPNMANTLTGWEQTITLGKVVQTIDQGDLVETINWTTGQAVVQPLSAQQLLLKPEGQRGWQYFWLHAKTNFGLSLSDRVIYKETQFKVTAVKDYSDYGYYDIELTQDYQEN